MEVVATYLTALSRPRADDSLLLLLEGIGGLDADEKHVIKEIVEGILLKHQGKRLIRS